jgi:hypothetical protein
VSGDRNTARNSLELSISLSPFAQRHALLLNTRIRLATLRKDVGIEKGIEKAVGIHHASRLRNQLAGTAGA